jgi:hypothetical protein
LFFFFKFCPYFKKILDTKNGEKVEKMENGKCCKIFFSVLNINQMGLKSSSGCKESKNMLAIQKGIRKKFKKSI